MNTGGEAGEHRPDGGRSSPLGASERPREWHDCRPVRVTCRERQVDTEAAVRELNVVGVRVELPTNQPIVLLKEVDGDRYLPIWIGAVEATAIAYEQQGVKPARPLTHDLMRDMLAALKAPLRAVEIVEMRDNIFYAELVIGDNVRVSARPSDSIALALRVGAPIRCADQVLTEAAIVIPDEQEDEVEKFREFLEQVRPEDFAG
ncbi:hypothetical protein GCM10010399_44560 [Dactylosporangium fulvum]